MRFDVAARGLWAAVATVFGLFFGARGDKGTAVTTKRRNTLFLFALALLLAVSRRPAPRVVVVVLLVFFVVAATIWVRGQYEDFLNDRPWAMPGWLTFLMFVLGLSVLGLILITDLAISPIWVAIPFYIGTGSVLAKVRRDASKDRPQRYYLFVFALVVLGLVTFLYGANQLSHNFWAPLALGLSLLAFIPLAVAVLAEDAIRQLADVKLADVQKPLAPEAQEHGGHWVRWRVRLGRWLAPLGRWLVPLGRWLTPPERWLDGLGRWLAPLGWGGPDTPERSERRACWRIRLGWGGSVLFAVVVIAAGVCAQSLWASVACVVIGLLTVAVVSSTHADLVAVLAVIALIGITPAQATIPDALTPTEGAHVLVAIGDSYMSGEGASIYYKGTDNAGEDVCRRSPTSWAAMAGQEKQYFDGLMFLACSGALTANVQESESPHTTPTAQLGEDLTQLQKYTEQVDLLSFTPKLVALSVGGNDSGFSTIGLMCVAPGKCDEKQHWWLHGLDEVEIRLRELYAEVRAKFPRTPVVVIPYPDPIYAGEANCSQLALTTSERQFIAVFLNRLNRRIHDAARDSQFYYLAEMQESLAESHLQLCDPDNESRPGLNFIGLRSVTGTAEQRFSPLNWTHNSLHPNERGHAAMLRVFENWLAQQEKPIPFNATTSVNDSDAMADARTPPANRTTGYVAAECSVFAPPELSGCKTQGRDWAKQQVGNFLMWPGSVVLLLAIASAWCASVAVFAWRRRKFGGG